MRTVAELRRANNLSIPHNKDSVYKDIARKARKFNSIEIPKKLQEKLPFGSKPKDRPKSKKPTTDKIPVIMNTEEKKRSAAIQQLIQIKHEKMRKEKLKRGLQKKAHEVQKAKTDLVTKKRQREDRRERYREEDKKQKRARR